MSAPPRVSDAQIREAFARHRTVHAAADALRISRNALYKRLEPLYRRIRAITGYPA